MKTIESIAKKLKGKKVILRLDLNVPLHKHNITDTNRIDKIIPTLNFLINNKAKILILSHVGRPKGRVIKDLSMEPICRYLKKKINQNIHLIKTNIDHHKEKNLFDTIAYIQVKDLSKKDNNRVFLFNGWTFALSPTLQSIDHPVYDLWITSCENI